MRSFNSLIASLLAFTCFSAAAWEVQLTVEDNHPAPGFRPVTWGVPLLPGQAQDLRTLSLFQQVPDGGRKQVPAQFRELARWWRADNSLRWILVDIVVEKDAPGSTIFTLTEVAEAAPPPRYAISVESTADSITVETGVAKFVMNRKNFNLFESVILDLNGDGVLADNENLLAATAEHGSVMEDTFGQRYFGSEGTRSVEVMEAGPLRASVRAQGTHPAHKGEGYSKGMYGYDIILNFYAGSSEVYADVVVGNNFAESIGTPAIDDGSLLFKLADGASGYALLGDKPVTGSLAGTDSVCLYQDSNGAETWAENPGFGNMKTNGWEPLPDQLTSFRGYRVTQAPESAATLAQGDHARGTLNVWNKRGGVVLHVKNFWQQFPKAAEAAADGTVRFGLWPREWKYPHRITDNSGKGYEIALSFYAAQSENAESGASRAADVANRWDSKITLVPAMDHMAACGALSDLGPYSLPLKGLDKRPDTRVVANGPRMFTTDKLYGNAYGWQIFGERWRSCGGSGRRGARQPIAEDNYLYLWYLTGSPAWFEIGDARSRQFRDVRGYRIDNQDSFSFKNWDEYRRTHVCEHRARALPDNEETRKYQRGLPDYGTHWEYPNPEHTTLDLLYDRYLLFGDVRSLESMRCAAANSAYFVRDHAPDPNADLKTQARRLGRDSGWSLRTLERYWELTGDLAAKAMLDQTIAGFAPVIGKSPLWFGNSPQVHGSVWFTQIFSRAIAMTALHTRDQQALEICKSLAIGKEEKARQTFSTLFAVLYHMTGEEQYRKAVLGDGDGNHLLSLGGYFPVSDHWLLIQPPAAK